MIAAAVFQGLPLDAHWRYVGTFWQLFTPLAGVFGLTFVALFALHGALFLSLRTAWNLTIENTGAAASSMVILSWAGLILLPIVVIYQAIGYWIFRKRLHARSSLHF